MELDLSWIITKTIVLFLNNFYRKISFGFSFQSVFWCFLKTKWYVFTWWRATAFRSRQINRGSIINFDHYRRLIIFFIIICQANNWIRIVKSCLVVDFWDNFLICVWIYKLRINFIPYVSYDYHLVLEIKSEN